MTDPDTDSSDRVGPAKRDDDLEEWSPITTASLLSDALGRLYRNPSVLVGVMVAGVLVTAVDVVRRGDPVPTVGYAGLQTGDVRIAFGVVVNVISQNPTPPTALVDLEPIWLARTVWLEVLRGGAVVLASIYGFATLLDVRVHVSNTARYLIAFGGLALISVEIQMGLLGIPLLLVLFWILVKLSPFPGLVVAGEPIVAAVRRGWGLTRGHGWSLFGVVLSIGITNHALASVPVVGTVGSSLAAALHIGVVSAFIDRVETVEPVTPPPDD